MVNRFRGCLTIVGIVGTLAGSALAQEPTFSVEAVELNSVPVPGAPVSQVAVLPGDILTVEIYIRDWSPSGEDLAGYQAQIDPTTYLSGTAGNIQPVNYETTQKTRSGNKENCYINRKHPGHVHAEYEHLPLVDHRSKGYRWASLVLGGEKGPISDQDGSQYYCATLKLQVSDNAQGTFTVSLMEGANQSGLRDSNGRPILPVQIEALTIVVRPNLAELIAGLNGAEHVPDNQIDIDQNGEHNSADVLTVVSMLNTAR